MSPFNIRAKRRNAATVGVRGRGRRAFAASSRAICTDARLRSCAVHASVRRETRILSTCDASAGRCDTPRRDRLDRPKRRMHVADRSRPRLNARARALARRVHACARKALVRGACARMRTDAHENRAACARRHACGGMHTHESLVLPVAPAPRVPVRHARAPRRSILVRPIPCEARLAFGRTVSAPAHAGRCGETTCTSPERIERTVQYAGEKRRCAAAGAPSAERSTGGDGDVSPHAPENSTLCPGKTGAIQFGGQNGGGGIAWHVS